MKRKQRKSLPWRRFGNAIFSVIKFSDLFLWISTRIINYSRSYIKHSKQRFIRFLNTLKLIKKSRLRLVFPIHFSVFENRIKHPSSCWIHYVRLVGFIFFFSSFQQTRVLSMTILWYFFVCCTWWGFAGLNWILFNRYLNEHNLSKTFLLNYFSCCTKWL